MADIFISYSRKDVERVRPLVIRLEAEGWSVFWDRNIPPGKGWREVLESELAPAGCLLAVWSNDSIGSRWVIEEADMGADKNILLTARLDPVQPPIGFRTNQACDLADWDGRHDTPGLKSLMAEIANLLGNRKGVSIAPLDLAVVLGRPSVHPNLGAAINLVCRFSGDLDHDSEILGFCASVTGPDDLVRYDFDWRLVFDVTAGGLEHIRRIQQQSKIHIPAAGTLQTGIQLQAPILTDAVAWPEGGYSFKLRGWLDCSPHESLPNLKCDFDAYLGAWEAQQIETHLGFSDDDWRQRHYSDDAFGVPFTLSDVRQGLPAA